MTTLTKQRQQRKRREAGLLPIIILDGNRETLRIIYIGNTPHKALMSRGGWRSGRVRAATLEELGERLRG